MVKNLQTSLQFYRDFLGLTLWRQATETGSYIDQVVGIKHVTVEWVKLTTPDNFLIELLQYHSHPDEHPALVSSHKIGTAHVAFTVENIDAVYEQFIEHGYQCNAAPALSPEGQAKVMYCHDPDGFILEMVEIIRS